VCTRGNGGIVKPSCGVNEAGFERRKTRHKIKYAKHADAKNNEVRQDKRTPFLVRNITGSLGCAW
jgi:hypothetical protein